MEKNKKNYDEINKYDFYDKYYLHLAIGTKFEDCIEITKEDIKVNTKITKKGKINFTNLGNKIPT